MKILVFLTFIGISVLNDFLALKGDLISECLKNELIEEGNQYLRLGYIMSADQLTHGMDPWSTQKNESKGAVWCGAQDTFEIDSMRRNTNSVISEVFWNFHSGVSKRLNGETEFLTYPKQLDWQQLVADARLTPTPILVLLRDHRNELKESSSNDGQLFTMKTTHFVLSATINRTSRLLVKADIVTDESFYGDVSQVFNYSDFKSVGKIQFPSSITMSKMDGKLRSQVQIKTAAIEEFPASSLNRTAAFKKAFEKPPVGVTTTKYSDHISLLDLIGTDDRSVLVDFKDFLVVADAPLSEENGDLIIETAKRIYPGKPIKYFTFGHHHPDYIGGIRAFARAGAVILCTKGNEEYVKYIVSASHAIKGETSPNFQGEVRMQLVDSVYTIKDANNYKMDIYNLKDASNHTRDYLVFYFSEEKMLFEDDLVRISSKGEARQPSNRQVGLYNALNKLDLNIVDIVQSWPVSESSNVKSIFTFEELSKSVIGK